MYSPISSILISASLKMVSFPENLSLNLLAFQYLIEQIQIIYHLIDLELIVLNYKSLYDHVYQLAFLELLPINLKHWHHNLQYFIKFISLHLPWFFNPPHQINKITTSACHKLLQNFSRQPNSIFK